MSAPTAARCVWVVATDAMARRWARSLDPTKGTPYELAWGKARPLVTREEFEVARRRAAPDACLLTSGEALSFLEAGKVQGLAAVCVGLSTAAVAETYGVAVLGYGEGGGTELVQVILDLPSRPKRFLWLRGREARTEVAVLLRAAGVAVEELVTYAVDSEPGFLAALRAAPQPVAVMVGSPRGAEALAEGLEQAGRELPPDTEFLTSGWSTDRRLRELGYATARPGAVRGWFVARDAPRYHPPSA